MSAGVTEEQLQLLVAAAVRAVLEELRGRSGGDGPLVRVLVADTEVGLDLAVAALRRIESPRPRYEYVVAPGPTAQLTAQGVQALCGAWTRDTDEVGCPLAFAREADAVVAAVGRPTAVRVALTAPDTFASKLLFEALVWGKPTLVVTDGLGLEAPEATPQLRHALAEPVGRLEVFGATCVAAADLGPALEAALRGPSGFNAAGNRPLITADEVEAADGELLLPPGAIVTPLALDRARELGVRLRRVPH